MNEIAKKMAEGLRTLEYVGVVIVGVPKEIIEAFSTRSYEIGAALEKVRELAAKETRSGKTNQPREKLVVKWDCNIGLCRPAGRGRG